MKTLKYILPIFILPILLVAKESNYRTVGQLHSQNEVTEPAHVHNSNDANSQNREEIDLFLEDFENGENGWNLGNGWQIVDDQYGASETHSVNSPNDFSTQNGTWDLLSPVWTLPALGEGETMNFDFWIFGDMPDTDGDGDNYLEDYYTISIMDVDALAWHPSSTNSYDGESYWCGDEEVGGYLDSWIQFMDTPSFTVPTLGQLTADLMWTIEDPAGAVVAGSCTDGWDAANVQISVDGGQSWELLVSNQMPYDFDCGYGWIWNSPEYDTGGSLNNVAAGWGGDSNGWNNHSFNLAQYAGQEAIVRFAFGSDPAFCTLDDGSITGFHVDNINVSGVLDCSPENSCETAVSGAVWVDQFYDYCDDAQPGGLGWEQYLPGYPFNGNVFMDISDFAEKNVTFRIQTRYDADDDGGSGLGLHIDDFRIYKVSGGSYPPPTGLAGEAGDMSANLSWNDMNASGTDDFIYDNDAFDNGITVTGNSAWAGERIDLAGPSTINSISVFNNNTVDTTLTVAVFGQFGSLFGNEEVYSTTVEALAGTWSTVDVSWDMTNAFIVAHEFNGSFSAALDESAAGTGHSMVMLNAGWDNWLDIAAANALADGEWGIRTNVTFQGAGVTYNVYQDGVMVQSALGTNSATADGLDNNVDYSFAVSATYGDGEESGLSSSIVVTPFAQTVHEEYHDDGSAESSFEAGSGNFAAVKYSAATDEDVVRFKWFQEGEGGAFYVKIFDDVNGAPGDELFSQVVAGGLVDGWNDKDLLANGWTVSGDFWIGTKSFSSTQPFGVDDSGTGTSMSSIGTSGEWTPIDGNLMIRVFLDCGADCDSGSECTAGDVNSDGIINVLDIVASVNFVLGSSSPSESEACASDYNGDGIINVLDIVAMVNIVLGG